jgi:hypothetical protein
MIIVINLESISFFNNFIILIESLQHYFGLQFNLSQEVFNQLLDLYPELLLPNLLKIFNYLSYQKTMGNVNTCILTSSKNYNITFICKLIKYFNYKLKRKLITNYLTYNDFYKTYLKKYYYESVLYISNQKHFIRDYTGNVQYIILDEYTYYISILNMVSRIKKSELFHLLNEPFFLFEIKMEREMNKYKYIFYKNNDSSICKNTEVGTILLNVIHKIIK